MSITPIPVTPAPSPPTGRAGAVAPATGAQGAAGGFAALVAQLMAGHAVPVPVVGVPTPQPDSLTDPEPDAAVEPDAEGEDEVTGSAPGAVPATGPAVTPPAPGAAGADGDSGPDPGATAPRLPAADTQSPPVTTATAPAPTSAAASPAASPDARPAEPAPQVAAPPAAPAPSPTAEPTTTPVPPIGSAAPATAAGATAETRAVAPAPAMSQLVPDITRLVSAGDGTHRLTMTLQPEALGEVRVTLTVRNGEVHVRLAAGVEAQQALAEGAPELQRVLELTGATETRVVVRDLAAPQNQGQTQNQPGTTTPHHGAGAHGDADATGDRRGSTPDQHAGTRGGTTARDGATDGASVPRPEPATGTRSLGVDVTM
jgi:flagellar hook-length control protein FliK